MSQPPYSYFYDGLVKVINFFEKSPDRLKRVFAGGRPPSGLKAASFHGLIINRFHRSLIMQELCQKKNPVKCMRFQQGLGKIDKFYQSP
jgi:hypothetical protein